jgi:hypothetical protein
MYTEQVKLTHSKNEHLEDTVARSLPTGASRGFLPAVVFPHTWRDRFGNDTALWSCYFIKMEKKGKKRKKEKKKKGKLFIVEPLLKICIRIRRSQSMPRCERAVCLRNCKEIT